MPEPIVIVASWSEVQSWRICPMKHWMSYRRRQPSDRTKGRGRNIGTLWHGLMQGWFKARIDGGTITEEELDALYGEFIGWEAKSTEEHDIIQTLMWMWAGFIEAGDPFFDWDVIEAEQEHIVELPPVPGQPDHVTIFIKAIIDLVLKKGNRYAVVDHKSTSKKLAPDSLSRDMDMDDQLTSYLGTLWLEWDIPAHRMQATWNYAITKDLVKTPRPLEDRYWLARSARGTDELVRGMAEFSESVLDAYARPLAIEPPRHPDKEHCRWTCDWREPCFYARSANRPVELDEPVKADQVPLGLAPRRYKGE